MPYEIVLFLKQRANKWQVLIHSQFLVITSGEKIAQFLDDYNSFTQLSKMKQKKTKYQNLKLQN